MGRQHIHVLEDVSSPKFYRFSTLAVKILAALKKKKNGKVILKILYENAKEKWLNYTI